MTTYPARFRLRAVTEVSRIQEKWDLPELCSDPFEIFSTVINRLKLPQHSHQIIPYCYGMRHIAGRKWIDIPNSEIEAARADLLRDVVPLLTDRDFPRPPLTPRRIFTAQTIQDDPFRPKIPEPMVMLQNWTVQGSIHANLKFWFHVLFWLKGLLALMDHSIGKSHEELFILDRRPENVEQPSYWRTREIIPTPAEAMDLSICNLDPRFCGPGYFPVVAGLPSSEDVATISWFKRSHHRETLKYMEHLCFLYDIIDEELIPQVEKKLERLVNRELQWLANKDPEPVTPYYIDYEHLEDVDCGDCGVAIQNLAAGLESKEWVTMCEAMFGLRSLAKYHSRRLKDFLGVAIAVILAKLVKGTRPSVVKSAIMACADLLVVYPDSIISFINPMMDSLLQVIGLHRFVSREATLLLLSMARRIHIAHAILLPKIVPLLHGRSPFVRAKAYQFLRLCLPVRVRERNDFIIQYVVLMKSHLVQRKS